MLDFIDTLIAVLQYVVLALMPLCAYACKRIVREWSVP